MKTAMQELIDELRQTRDEGEPEYKTAYNLAIAIANQYLEKEKHHIKLFYFSGGADLDLSGNIEQQFEECYDQTYNQSN